MLRIIKQQQDKVMAELCQKIVAKKWAEEMVAQTPEDIKNIEDIELITDEETKEIHVQYLKDLDNVKTNQLHIESDVFAYNVLKSCEKEIKSLLCIK